MAGFRNLPSLEQALREAEAKLTGGTDGNNAIVVLMGGGGAPCGDIERCAVYNVQNYQGKNKGYEKIVSDLNEEGIDLSIIAFGDEPDSAFDRAIQFWGVLGRSWPRITRGFHYLRYDEVGVNAAREMAEVFLRLSQRADTAKVCGSATVDPMLDKVHFSLLSTDRFVLDAIFKYDVEGKTLEAPGAGRRTGDGGRGSCCTRGRRWAKRLTCSTMYTVTRRRRSGGSTAIRTPRWPICRCCGRMKIVVVTPLGEIVQSQAGQKNKPDDFIRFRIVDQEGATIPETKGLESQVTGTIDLGEDEPYRLTFDYDDKTQEWKSNEALPAEDTGDYQGRVGRGDDGPEWGWDLSFFSEGGIQGDEADPVCAAVRGAGCR